MRGISFEWSDRRVLTGALAQMGEDRSPSFCGELVERGLQNTFTEPSSIVTSASPFQVISSEFREGNGTGEGDFRFSGERGSRASPASVPRILQFNVCGEESIRGMEAYNRPQSFEQVYSEDQVQNGDSQVDPGSHQRGRLAVLSGPEGRVSSDSDSRGFTPPLEILLEREGVAISSSLFRAHNSSSGFHQGLCASSNIPPCQENTYAEIPGRLVVPQQFRGGSTLFEGSGSRVVSSIGNKSQLEEVLLGTRTGGHLSGNAPQVNTFEGFPDEGEDFEFKRMHSKFCQGTCTSCKTLASLNWTNVIFDGSGTGRQKKDKKSTVRFTQELGQEERSGVNSVESGDFGGPDVVVESQQSGRGNSIGDALARFSDVLGRLERRLGGVLGGHDGFRGVESSGKTTINKLERTVSDRKSPASLQPVLQIKNRGHLFRKHGSSVLFKERRGGRGPKS